MRWENLAFLHWPVDAREIRRLVPEPLEIDTFDGSAWVAVTPFTMLGVRLAGLPGVPTATNFPELNVRTYVRLGGHAGVWFFSLDAASRVAVAAARRVTGLPYHHADMSSRPDGDTIVYASRRLEPRAPGAAFSARFRPIGDASHSARGSFEFWSTERYCLFSFRSSRLLRLDIEHLPWPLQPAEARIAENTMAAAAGIALPTIPPRAHFARRLDVLAHWPVMAR
jgi:uncharacterized protein YqjF (DUF2071 family)